MHKEYKRNWLLAAVLLSLPQSAFAMGGEGIFGGLLQVVLFFLAAAALLIIWLGVYIYKRSESAFYKAVGISIFAAIGYVLLSGSSSSSMPELMLWAVFLTFPILFVVLFLVAAVVDSMPVR
jgi:hypothetical protein